MSGQEIFHQKIKQETGSSQPTQREKESHTDTTAHSMKCELNVHGTKVATKTQRVATVFLNSSVLSELGKSLER